MRHIEKGGFVQVKSNGKSVRKLGQLDLDGGVLPESFLPSKSKPDSFDHFVQFYEAEDFLLNSLSEFTKSALNAGEPVLVIATKEHREGLREKLIRCGLDIDGARLSEQFVEHDAHEILSKFFVSGQIVPALCSEVVGNLIAQLSKKSRPVRIFGEMVALLLMEGNYRAAIELEEMWNDLGKTHSFSLFCAYPLCGFDGEPLDAVLSDVCVAHSHVIPAESFSTVIDTDDRNRKIIELQRKARQLESEIAERKKVEHERAKLLAREQAARIRAEEANRMKDEFLATISHELRTPLNAILGWSHLLREKELDKNTTHHAIATIENNARVQAQLVEDILDVSRVITGKLRLNIEPLDIAAIINAAIDSVESAANSKNIRVGVTLDSSARHIFGDSTRLQQVIWNLLSNAVKFTHPGGFVRVKLERHNSDVRISVSDTGKGINSDFLPFIFDNFSQGDGSTTRRYGGLGLGLAIVRHLVELHGGTVRAESPGENCGSTFTITLPQTAAKKKTKNRKRIDEDLPATADETARKSPPLLKNLRILIVDDSPDNLQMLTVLLSNYEAEVQTAASAGETLKLVDVFQPDVIVSDIAMPDEDGFSLIEKIRALQAKSGKQIPAIALTSYTRSEDRALALAAGFDMFVPKPVEPNELIAIIANLTESKANLIG